MQDPIRDITVVVTSCNRHDLLARTLESFFDYETEHRIARVIVAEDGNASPKQVCDKFGAEYFCSGERIGQMRMIDQAYAQVKTPYIFHLEDDWEFYRAGFMERSRQMLRDPLVLTTWLRAWNDTGGMPLEKCVPDRTWGVLAVGYCGVWHGFTFNPGLRRLSDYQRLGSFSGQTLTLNLTPRIPTVGLLYEAEASLFYYRLGYRAVILDETGYVRHIGDERHVHDPDSLKV